MLNEQQKSLGFGSTVYAATSVSLTKFNDLRLFFYMENHKLFYYFTTI